MTATKTAWGQLQAELEELAARDLRRQLRLITGPQGSRTTMDGRPLTLLCSNNYLGLAAHPQLREAACRMVEKYGCSAGASRLISGTMTLHRELEEELAAFKGVEAALVYNCGYMANLGIIATLATRGDLVLSDALNHASIVDGCRLSRADLLVYRHADPAHLEELLATRGPAYRRRLIVTDSVFSMDGDLAPLPAIAALAERYDALLMVDDAHATGVLGPGGRGSAAHFGLNGEKIDILMGTLGKALGSCGAFVAGRRELVDYLVNKSRSFIYTTALPPAVLAASLAAVRLLRAAPEMVVELRRKSDYFRRRLQQLGFAVADDPTPIIPVVVGDPGTTMNLSRNFLQEGIFIQGIRPPTVEKGGSRLRITICRDLEETEMERVLDLFSRWRAAFPA